MKDISLLVMAAGLGSRYGGLKQLDSVGPNGETIIDYSVYDAIQVGFRRAVFIIRKEFESNFREKVTDKYSDSIQVEFVFQNLYNLPGGFRCPDGRKKPWGTGHAILSASDLIDAPFVAINADDFYGRESFGKLAKFYTNEQRAFSMAAYRLDKTLSDFGGVTRGICKLENDRLSAITETRNVQKTDSGISSDSEVDIDGSELVSVNMWGFTPILFDYLNEMWVNFLKEYGMELSNEFLIPEVINDLIQTNRESIQVLHSKANWYGVTYKEDKLFVETEIRKLVEGGIYPEKLF